MYIYVSMSVTLSAPGAIRGGGGGGGQACVQDGILTSFMDAAFVLLAHEGSEIWTN